MRRAALLLLVAAMTGCPDVDLDGLVFPCTADGECPGTMRCDAVTGSCDAAAVARPPPESRPPGSAHGALLGLGLEGGMVVRWYERGAFTRRPDLNAPDDGEDAEAHALTAPRVVAVAKAEGSPATTFFLDGRVAVGPTADPAREVVGRFDGAIPGTIVGIAMTPEGSTVTWLDDGRVLFGTIEDLAVDGSAETTWPIGKRPRDVDAVFLDADGSAWAVFQDGAVARGTPEDLSIAVTPGRLVGVAVSRSPRTYLYYATGWCKVLDGRLSDSFSPQAEPWTGDWANMSIAARRWFDVPAGRRPDSIVGVVMGERSPDRAYAFFDDGTRTESDGPYDFRAPPLPTTLVPSQASRVIDAALTEGNRLTTYLRPDELFVGRLATPLESGPRAVNFPPGQSFATIAAVGGELGYTRTATRTGSFWMLFADGSITEGRSYDLEGEAARRDLGYRSIRGP